MTFRASQRTMWTGCLALALGWASVDRASAELVVYDGFDGYATGNLNGQNPTGNTVGLNTGATWSSTNNSLTYISSGLTFGDLVVNGGAIQAVSGTHVSSAPMSLSGAVVGTLYGSYLVEFASTSTGDGAGAHSRIATTNSTDGSRFRVDADSRNNGVSNLGTLYNQSNPTNATTGLATSETYLVISRWTNVGEALSGGNPGVATSYALTEAQFESFLLGGGDDAYLDGATVGTGDSEISVRVSTDPLTTGGPVTFATGLQAQFISVSVSVIFDEMRYGTTLASVTPVPEPGTWALLAFGLSAAGGAAWRRRKRAEV